MRPSDGDTPIAVVLLSGGMDSCVTAAIARLSCEPAFLHVGYGQRTEERERRAFFDIARHYGVERTLVARLDHLGAVGGSALTDPSRDAVRARGPGSTIPDTYVPFRNTHLLAMAVSWAEVLGARSVYIGAVQVDSSGYPDCGEEYFAAFNRLVKLGPRPETHIEVMTPLIHLGKDEIVREGLRLGAPLHPTRSCHTRQEVARGRCGACLLRLRGFDAAGARDPGPYAP